MRTTVRLDERLLRQAKQFAARNGRTLTAVIDDALRQFLSRREAPAERRRFGIRPFRGPAPPPGWTLPAPRHSARGGAGAMAARCRSRSGAERARQQGGERVPTAGDCSRGPGHRWRHALAYPRHERSRAGKRTGLSGLPADGIPDAPRARATRAL